MVDLVFASLKSQGMIGLRRCLRPVVMLALGSFCSFPFPHFVFSELVGNMA